MSKLRLIFQNPNLTSPNFATMQHLFVCGAPRSGTTALWNLLSSDHRIILGVERYGNLFFRETLSAQLFSPERFLTALPGDTFYDDLGEYNNYYTTLTRESFDQALYVGDKIPLLFRQIEPLLSSLQNSKIIFALRNVFDVAASYEARADDPLDSSWSRDKRTSEAIADWSASMRALRDYLDDDRVFPVVYEDFFFNSDLTYFQDLYTFLDIEPSNAGIEKMENILRRSTELEHSRARNLSVECVQQICETAPFGLYRDVLASARSVRRKARTGT